MRSRKIVVQLTKMNKKMAIVFCRRCGKEIREAAPSCPHYGAMRAEVDDITALRLYFHSKAGVPQMRGKESTFYEEANTEILGVPCIMRFGFSSEKKCSMTVVTSSCVWIFSGSGQDFFGAIYLPVDEDSHAPSILNLTIDRAIEQAILSPKFEARKALGI